MVCFKNDHFPLCGGKSNSSIKNTVRRHNKYKKLFKKSFPHIVHGQVLISKIRFVWYPVTHLVHCFYENY
jgi:hypothetical protein